MSMEGLEALHHDSVLCWVVSTVSCSDTSSILTGRSRTGADRPSISTSHHTKGYVKRRFFFLTIARWWGWYAVYLAWVREGSIDFKFEKPLDSHNRSPLDCATCPAPVFTLRGCVRSYMMRTTQWHVRAKVDRL
ncbi:hypothetical protein BGZ61DRAFT_1376 [Ilyonectria robusta]|uniref:uncharacterized protein n=1 Tax=Ilyonectria robusta TaxID=1079257 RepID=UPI001E8D4489|nr:uncharacterized protein BGZ61DRAFT_1376 [Ilyonectria robusta]KAH8736699.1 hypothetical protein BGZ61DRAFT_1376 [Ilyonectria robusta]